MIVTFGAYLDGTSAVASVKVCTTWRDHLKDQAVHAKEDEYCRRVGYRPELVQALRSRQLSLWRLPEVDLRGNTGSTDYIDFLGPEDVVSPLMKFTDAYGRVGLALKVRGNADGNVKLITGTGPIRQVSEVLALFKRYSNTNNKTWVTGGGSGFSYSVYRAVHHPQHTADSMLSGCPTCPPFLNQDEIPWAVALITKTDPAMKIDGEIVQQVPTLLPPMPLKPVVEQPRAAANNVPISIHRQIWNAVSGFLLWIAALFSSFIAYCRGQ